MSTDVIIGYDGKPRCRWAGHGDTGLGRYHDQVWGTRTYEESALFEALILGVFQVGLSWSVVFGKREAFREAFREFDVAKVAVMTDRDMDRLVHDASIIRNRAKIQATVDNARAMLAASPSLAELARSYELSRKRAPRSLAALPRPASPNLPPARRRTVAATHGRLAGAAAGDAIRAARHHRWAPARRPRRRSALGDPRPGPRALVTPATERRRTGGARRPELNRYPVHSNPQAQGTEATERLGCARGRSQLDIRARSSGDRALPCGGRGRTFESCRAHGSNKPFSKARNAEKCTIRPSYSASVRTREADESCSEGAGGEGVLGLADRPSGDLGASEDGLLQDRRALVADTAA
jgi:DNA-3-methyladenine glycosylase I